MCKGLVLYVLLIIHSCFTANQSKTISGEGKSHLESIDIISRNMGEAQSLVDENTRLLQRREEAGSPSYCRYYWIIAVESLVLLLLLYIGL